MQDKTDANPDFEDAAGGRKEAAGGTPAVPGKAFRPGYLGNALPSNPPQ